MLRSGLGVVEALETFQERGSAASSVSGEMLERLQTGESLAAAMTSCGQFSAGLLACVRASELTGDLGESLARFAGNAARLRQMRSRLVSALLYPALLVAVACLVVLFLMAYVVPRFALVLESSQQELPWLSQLLILVGHFLHRHQTELWLVLGTSAGAGAWVLWFQMRSGRMAQHLGSLAARTPGLSALVRSFGQGQMTRTAAMLVRSGIPALKALAMSRDLLWGADRVSLDRALAASTAGAPLASSLHQAGLIDGLGLRVLRVAEQTGALELALDRLADVHDARLDRQLERAARLIEPVVMLLIGLLVGGIVVLMYLPIFQLAAGIQ